MSNFKDKKNKFMDNRDHFDKALNGEKDNKQTNDNVNKQQNALDFLPESTDNEKVKGYNFTIKPSTRKKLTELARQKGYKSDSSFLNDLIDSLYSQD